MPSAVTLDNLVFVFGEFIVWITYIYIHQYVHNCLFKGGTEYQKKQLADTVRRILAVNSLKEENSQRFLVDDCPVSHVVFDNSIVVNRSRC